VTAETSEAVRVGCGDEQVQRLIGPFDAPRMSK
jgi:hypothetical protein